MKYSAGAETALKRDNQYMLKYMLNYIVRTREVIPIWSLHKKPDSYSPKSLYRHHGVGIYDNSKQEEYSIAYSKSVHMSRV